jgi:DNA-binding MltR family transcriptional regulator
MWQQLHNESDRGIALIMVAYLDDVLAGALRAALVDDKEAAEVLFGPHGSASSLSERINLAYMVGLIGPRMRDDMIILKDIRNAFAHYHHDVKFEDQDIDARCHNFKTLPKYRQDAKASMNALRERLKVKEMSSARWVFCYATINLIVTLENLAKTLPHARPGTDVMG